VILVDSSVWINYFNGKPTPEVKRLDSILGIEPIAIGDLILVEVLQGFRKDSNYKTAKKLLSSLTVFNMMDVRIAIKSAENFRLLRKRGITVRKTIDTIIATFCIQQGLPLLHSDKDFQPFHKYLLLRNAA
jgi:predicted nucleic acid-binding protein